MKISIAELVDLVNEKTLLKLQKKAIAKYEWTPNKKIRITYTNGTVEHYGCYFDCFAALNAKYRLNLEPRYSDLTLFGNNKNEEEETVVKKKSNPHIDKIILRLTKVLNRIEKSKKSIHFNLAEIQQAVFMMKKDIFLCNPYDLKVALSDLYNKLYASDKDMVVYFERIKKEIDSFG
jgi:hypothetical protein